MTESLTRITVLDTPNGDIDAERETSKFITLHDKDSHARLDVRASLLGTSDVEACPVVASDADRDTIYSGEIVNVESKCTFRGKTLQLTCQPPVTGSAPIILP